MIQVPTCQSHSKASVRLASCLHETSSTMELVVIIFMLFTTSHEIWKITIGHVEQVYHCNLRPALEGILCSHHDLEIQHTRGVHPTPVAMSVNSARGAHKQVQWYIGPMKMPAWAGYAVSYLMIVFKAEMTKRLTQRCTDTHRRDKKKPWNTGLKGQRKCRVMFRKWSNFLPLSLLCFHTYFYKRGEHAL